MAELEVEGRQYRTGKLNAFKQFHLMRKLLPLFSGMGESLSQMPATVGSGEGQFWHSLSPIAQAVADMSDDDSEWIIKTCLAAVTVFNGRNWVPVATPTGELMFEDIDLSQMLQLAFGVIQENLGNFFPGALPNGSDGEAQASPLPMSQ
jgi:hypothetical protein